MRRLPIVYILVLSGLAALAGWLYWPGAPATRAAPAGGQVTTITFWNSWTNAAVVDKLAQVVAAFNRTHPNIHVRDVSGIPMQRLLLSITGGNPPDVAVLYPGGTLSTWVNNGAVRSLTPFVRQSHYNLGRFVPAMVRHAEFHGQLYALPFGNGAYMLYWNRTLFRRAGIAGPPATLSQLASDARRLTARGQNGYRRLGFIPLMGGEGFPLYARLFGGHLWDAQRGRFTINSQANIRALTWLANYVHGYGSAQVDKFEAGFGINGESPFFIGKVAMEITGQWNVFNIHNYAPHLSYGVAPIPYWSANPAMRNSDALRGNSLIIPKGARHPQAAWTFMTWLQTGQAPVLVAKALQNMPAVRSYLDNPQLTRIDAPQYTSFLHYLQGPNVVPWLPPTPVTGQLGIVLTQDVQLALDGLRSPRQALDLAQQTMMQALTNTAH